MADLALGYSKTALDFVVNKVQSAIKEEEERWQTVQRDLVFITGEFEMMQSFLNTADRERLRSLVVRTWVQQVRDLSYDVEDGIDLVLRLDFGKRPWWLRLLPSWMKAAPEAPVDEAVAEIAQLKARVADVSDRNTRYSLVTDSRAKPGGAFRVPGGGSAHINTNDFTDLNRCFNLHDKSLRVVSVLSETVGDLETLLFIRELYEETSRRFSRRAWVKVTHPFDPREFIRSLLAQFLRSSCEAQGDKILGVQVLAKMEEIQLMDGFVHQVSMHNFLIVLEGVSSMEEWDAIKTYLPDRMNRSRIIVWTDHVEMATICTGMPYRTFVIRQSSPDHPSYIFYGGDSDEAARDILLVDGLERPWSDEARAIFDYARCCDIPRVAVWGDPGVGKTALVRAVYDHVQRELDPSAGGFAQQAWADVPDPLDDADDVARDILWGLTNNTWSGGDLVPTCQFVLKSRTGRTLVVLDGVRSVHDWDRINKDLICAMQQRTSFVIVITQDEGVAEHVGRIPGMRRPCVVRVAGDSDPLAAADWEADSVEEQDSVDEQAAAAAAAASSSAAATARLHGRRGEIDELVKVLMDKNSRCVAVWGPPGVGKTELVRAVYDHVAAKDESDEVRFRNRAWANVPDPFVDVVGVSRDIIWWMTTYGTVWPRPSGHDDVTACRDMLENTPGRTLVVVDGVRSREDWDRINGDVTRVLQPGSCVVVVTGDESVAAHCVGRPDVDHVLRINRLGAAVAHRLFIKTVIEKAQLSNDEADKLVADLQIGPGLRSLSSKCGGLPKFVVTIACYLADQYWDQRVAEMRLLNDNFIHQLQKNPEFDCLKYVLAWLHSAFDGSPQLLKKCIFYLSLFPRDSNTRWKRLVRRWIAEGYCTMEEADDLIGKVSDLFLFQPWETVIPVPSAMRKKTPCQVNSSFLDYIISRQTQEKTFLPLELSVLDGTSSLNTNRVGQHLTIRSDWAGNKAAYIRLDFSLLRSLTVSGEWKPFFISQKMRVLRVLDLEGTCKLENGHLDEIGQLMPRLKFLSLRGCKPISCLPDSLADLTLLETLDVRHTHITVLPKTITKLQKLQHIRAGPAPPTQQDEQRPGQSWWSTLSASARACLSKSPGGNHRGVEVPPGMGGMEALHTLGVVDVDMAGGKALLAELRKKNKNIKKNKEKNKKKKKKKNKKGDESHPLRNLSLCGLNWSQHLIHCISSLDQLESLSIRAEKLQVQHFSLPPNLVKLSLHVAGILHQGAVDAIKGHGKLQTLHLHAKEVEKDGTVSFSAATKAGEFGGGSFSEVKILEISCSSSFRVMFSQQAMQKLELLIVHCSSGSPSEISGMEQLRALKQVWLTGSYDHTLKKALEEQLPEHPNKPALNMEE